MHPYRIPIGLNGTYTTQKFRFKRGLLNQN